MLWLTALTIRQGDSGGAFLSIGPGTLNDYVPAAAMTPRLEGIAVAIIQLPWNDGQTLTLNAVNPITHPFIYCGILKAVADYRKRTGKQGARPGFILPHIDKLPTECEKREVAEFTPLSELQGE